MMYREKLMLAGFGLGSANSSIRQARTADKNSADPSIFSCYEGRLTSSFSRAVVGLCLVATLILSKLKIPTGHVFDCLRRSAWASMGSEGFENVRLCATNSVRTNFKNEHLPVVCSRMLYRARLFLPDESVARYPTFSWWRSVLWNRMN